MGSDGGNKERKKALEKKGKIKCGYCKPHKGENEGRKPRTDKYKDKGFNKMHMDPSDERVIVPQFPSGGGPMRGMRISDFTKLIKE